MKNTFLLIVFLWFISAASLMANFTCQDLSIAVDGRFFPSTVSNGTRGGLSFSVNKKGQAMAVWSVEDVGVAAGRVQAAYFDGDMWHLPAVNEFISDDGIVTSIDSQWPWVSLNDEGQAVVVWYDYTPALALMRARRFDSSLTPAGDIETIAMIDGNVVGGRGRARVAVNSEGKAFVVWQEREAAAPNDDEVYYSSSGANPGDAWAAKQTTNALEAVGAESPRMMSNVALSLCVESNSAYFVYVSGSSSTESLAFLGRYDFASDTVSRITTFGTTNTAGPFDIDTDVSQFGAACTSDDKKGFISFQGKDSGNPTENVNSIFNVANALNQDPTFINTQDNNADSSMIIPISAMAINNNNDFFGVQILPNQTDYPSTLYARSNVLGNGTVTGTAQKTLIGFNDLPQACISAIGAGVMVFYTSDSMFSSQAGQIGLVAFNKQNGNFVFSDEKTVGKATLLNRSSINSVLPFYLDCAGANAGLIWWDQGDGVIRSLLANGTNTPLVPSTATNAAGICSLNRFPTQGELFYTLTWTPATDQGIIRQDVLRNGEVIASVSPSQSVYFDHNRSASESDTYGIVTVVQVGNLQLSSVPAVIEPVCP